MLHFNFDPKNLAYNYYKKGDKYNPNKTNATKLAKEISYPTLSNPDYLILVKRRDNINYFLKRIENKKLLILDVGGRLQPYRDIMDDKIKRYISVDPIMEGFVDSVALGEYLPFKEESFDIVISTQALSYVYFPQQFVDEVHRVLVHKGLFILSAPALFPIHHDEHWRFLPDGLRILLHEFDSIEILPEGYSIAGIARTINVCLNIFFNKELIKRICAKILIPFINKLGAYLDRLSNSNEQFTVNYTCFAQKR